VTLVLDGSLTLAWCFEDETTPAADALMLKVAKEGAVVPSLWRFEVANALQMAIRRKRIDSAYRDRAFASLSALRIRIDDAGDGFVWNATVQLAELYKLTVYDAAYLELAQRMRLPLATLDSDLAAAARSAGVEVFP
jgi:predicted nucleic acid-binding protein